MALRHVQSTVSIAGVRVKDGVTVQTASTEPSAQAEVSIHSSPPIRVPEDSTAHGSWPVLPAATTPQAPTLTLMVDRQTPDKAQTPISVPRLSGVSPLRLSHGVSSGLFFPGDGVLFLLCSSFSFFPPHFLALWCEETGYVLDFADSLRKLFVFFSSL